MISRVDIESAGRRVYKNINSIVNPETKEFSDKKLQKEFITWLHNGGAKKYEKYWHELEFMM